MIQLFGVQQKTEPSLHHQIGEVQTSTGDWLISVCRDNHLQGEDKLTTYRFNTGAAKHRFCSICGVQSFYHPRSNPDAVGESIIPVFSRFLSAIFQLLCHTASTETLSSWFDGTRSTDKSGNKLWRQRHHRLSEHLFCDKDFVNNHLMLSNSENSSKVNDWVTPFRP